MLFRQIFDPRLSQYAYLIGCQRTGEAILIDPQRDVDRYLSLAEDEGVRITAVAETHIHADFLSGARELAHRVGAKVYVSGLGGPEWQSQWLDTDDVDFQRLQDGDAFHIGNIELKAVYSPGHTPEHMSYLVTDHGGGAEEPMGLASGDFVFVGDLGRPDLLESAAGESGAMEPAARRLFESAEAFLDLPDHLQVWPGHGAGSACGKALGAVPMSTVGYERRHNVSLDAVRRGRDTFVQQILDGQPEPPLYFARMKRLNRQGPPLLGELPQPRRLATEELKPQAPTSGPRHASTSGTSDSDETVWIDTRRNRQAYFSGHLPGALYAPLDRSFPTVVGSYVEPETSILLLVEEHELEEAVRELIRIGLDRVIGWAPPGELGTYGKDLVTTKTLDLETAQQLAADDGVLALDVRRRSEVQAGALKGAHNIAHTRLADRLDELPRGKELLVYCMTGMRAAVASAFLEHRGFRVRAVQDDFPTWLTHNRASGTEQSPKRSEKGE